VNAGELGFKTGSGFLKWDEHTMAETRNKLSRHLLEFLSKAQCATTQGGNAERSLKANLRRRNDETER
jgi:3-hydroxyacyl-CoA dehydrogenase